MKYILALDQGTTSSRAILFNDKAEVVTKTQKEFPQHYPKPGWVEHEPDDIWLSQISVAREAIEKANVSPRDIAAIGITNQRETTILWDRETGRAVYPAIVWQCRRSAERIEQLKQLGKADIIKDKTGLVLDAYFSASKIEWILDHVDGLRERAEKGEIAFGTVDTYLIWKLTRGNVHATDVTNASRTMLYNIHTLEWDDELLELFRIPRAILPEVMDSAGDFGMTHPEVIAGIEIPIRGVAGDQQASLFVQLCTDAGMVKNTYGTGCFMLMNTGDKIKNSQTGLISTIAWKRGDEIRYALEGSVFIAGAAIQWLRDELKMIYDAAQSEYYAGLVDDSDGVVVVPAFTGLGAPYWNMRARGAIFGLTRGTKREHIVRATLESIAYQTLDILTAMKQDTGLRVPHLQVDGGAAANGFLMQFQADMLNTTVRRLKITETTALGAAYLAGLEVGVWQSVEQLRTLQADVTVFKPSKSRQWIEVHYDQWQDAVRRVME
ncbi:MAG: glycerol kinase GlpK [Tissierellia bacterium]|nr:glycerol kinase GlpK [Tissierellia bacterium]